MEAIPTAAMAAAAAAAADAVPVGAADVHDRQLCPLQITAGPTLTTDTAAKNAHTLLADTRRRRPSHT